LLRLGRYFGPEYRKVRLLLLGAGMHPSLKKHAEENDNETQTDYIF